MREEEEFAQDEIDDDELAELESETLTEEEIAGIIQSQREQPDAPDLDSEEVS